MENIYIFLFTLLLFNCNNIDQESTTLTEENEAFVSALDLSSYPEIKQSNLTFYNRAGLQKDFLEIIKENGVNTIRLRLWVDPQNEHSSLAEVQEFTTELKSKGFNIWLSLHYSDHWADPGKQVIPLLWQNLSFEELKSTVYNYTANVMDQICPDYIQIGNEINSGLLHPKGKIENNIEQFLELMDSGISAVRANHCETDIILHYAGLHNSNDFFQKVGSLDYDIIGISYYPIWHGKSLIELSNTISELQSTFSKEILVAEVAYPFTLNWADWTNNIVGLDEQLILPEYPATAEGQKKFIARIKEIMIEFERGLGFCYWGAELVAWKGAMSENASPWENQALFDFDFKALPALQEFQTD